MSLSKKTNITKIRKKLDLLDNQLLSLIKKRTALVKKNMFYIQAGAGIVADSVPEKEYQETVNKAKALINAAN